MSTVDLKSAVTNRVTVIKQDREAKFYDRYLMYNDDYYQLVLDKLNRVFTSVVALKLHEMIDDTDNIFTTVIKQISRVYSFGVTRQTDHEPTQEYINKGVIQKTMKQLNNYINAFNDVIVQVAWNEKKNEPKFIFRLPHKTRVELDDDGNLIGVEYFVSKEDKKEKWAYWSDSEHYYKVYDNGNKEEFTKEYPEGNEKGINPFKELPFFVAQNGFRDGSFWDKTSGDDLVKITIDNAIYLTFLNYMKKMQSFKQIYIIGNEVSSISGQVLDPASALSVSGTDVNLGILDLQSDLKGLAETIEKSANKIATNYNISPSSFRLTGAPSSGFALKMENTKLDEDTKDQQKDFLGYEKELFRILKIVAEYNNVEFSDDVNITINEPFYSESRSETLDNRQKEIDMGIKSSIDFIMQDNEVDEDEAKKIYQENITFRNQANNRLTQGNLNLETTQTALEEANATT